MAQQFPEEVISLYGTMTVSSIAAGHTKATYAAMPKIQEALKERGPAKATAKAGLTNPFDVEISGNEDDINDWLYEGFLPMIPGPGDIIRKPFPPITIPPEIKWCAQIMRSLRAAQAELEIQRENQERAERLVAALDGNAHPIVVLFWALFKAGLEKINERVAEATADVIFFSELARRNDCF